MDAGESFDHLYVRCLCSNVEEHGRAPGRGDGPSAVADLADSYNFLDWVGCGRQGGEAGAQWRRKQKGSPRAAVCLLLLVTFPDCTPQHLALYRLRSCCPARQS